MSSYLLYMLLQRSIYDEYQESSGDDEPDVVSDLCRVCLRYGSIPIYGERDISNEVRMFGEIEISENDKFPKHLCKSCYNMLQAAIKFRESAIKSTYALRNEFVDYSACNDNISGCSSTSNIELIKKSKFVAKPLSSVASIVQTTKSVKKNIHAVHRKVKQKPQKLKCRICSKVFSRSYFKNHMLLHDSNPPKYMCEVCGKSFRQHCAYYSHRAVHQSDFPFKCNMCSYRGKTSGLLRTHKLQHGAHKFMCAECPAQFHTKSNLNKHYWIHKKPQFHCDLCKRAFHVKRDLEKHLAAQHLGIKNHICKLCGKGFGYKKAVRQHELNVHKRERIKTNGRMPSYMEAEQKSLLK